MQVDLNSCDKYTKAIFEAFIYRKDTAACIHNMISRQAMFSFSGFDLSPSKKVLEGQQMRKSGYNAILFKKGKEIDKYRVSDKKYSVGYLPHTKNLQIACTQIRYDGIRKIHPKLILFSVQTENPSLQLNSPQTTVLIDNPTQTRLNFC